MSVPRLLSAAAEQTAKCAVDAAQASNRTTEQE